MAVCKRPAAAVLMARHHQAHALNNRRHVVAKRTRPRPITIKKPAAADYEEDYTPSPCLREPAPGMLVYKARHRATGHTVAIEFPSSSSLPPELAREQLLREAACDGNPHVVAFRGVVRDPGTANPHVVMEFVAGGHSIRRDILRERRTSLPEATVRAIVRQLLAGARGMHDRGIVHRDIRPANVLVAGDGQVLKICGFGLAISQYDSDRPPHGEAGIMLYAAPEVLMGEPDPDALVDAWSIGCVMVELVGGGEVLVRRGGVDDALLDLQKEIPKLVTIFGVLDRHARPRPAALTCNPDKRLTAANALKLPWFAGDTD